MGDGEHLPLYGPGSAYVGIICALTAAGVALTVLLKATEEKWLHDLCGQEYDDYCARVNRCIPWFPRGQKPSCACGPWG